jgi:tetratricopeptide (TPR) repeat protein
VDVSAKIGRNDACHCGSGKKYKKCCGQAGGGAPSRAPVPPVDLAALTTLLNTRRHAELEATARAQIAAHPTLGVLWKLLGAALYAQGKDPLAALETAARLLPNDPEAETNLGNALRAQGRLPEAARRHRRAIEIQAAYPEAHNNLGAVLRDLGRHEEAAASFRCALALKDRFPLAHNNLGIALLACGRADQAVAAHRRALALAPDFAEAHAALGHALRRLGALEEAAASYRRATAIKPDDVESLRHLGDTLTALRQPEPAVAAYRRALELGPRSVEILGCLGNAWRDLGQPAAAAESYRAALALEPDSPELHNSLGNALLELGQIEPAVQSYRRSLELNPHAAKTHSNLGTALRDLAKLDEAAASHRKALELEPDSAEILTNLAVVERLRGHPAEVEACLGRALELDPTSTAAMLVRADVAADRGEFAAAEVLYRQTFALDPDSTSAWAGIAALRKMAEGDADWIAVARRLLARPRRPREIAHLQFAMGKYFDDLKEYAEAFASYRAANELIKTCRPPHDREQLSRTFAFIAQLYDRDWIEQARADPIVGSVPCPIFVVGMPRSGTSLAEQILASHPDVFGAGELSYWKTASFEMGRRSLEDGPSAALSAELARKYGELLATLAPRHAHVVDKMPGNFAHLGMIHAALPEARIIHMRRNPIDTCLSIYFQNFHIAHSYANDLDDLAHYYDEYLRLMDHWHAVLPSAAILDVPYEALVNEPETWSRRMVEFAGLPWHEACLNAHETVRSVSTFSKWQVRQKINRRSVQRWRNYAAFLGPLRRLSPEAAVA